MAIYHCSVQVIGRNEGRSSVAAAAYRAGEDLVNEYDGVEHDFTKKNWVEYTEIILPDNAPREYQDRGTLWNAVELAEKAKDAQLCREFELALPVELTREQQIEVVRQFVTENLTSQGMVADIAIHSPPVTNDRHQAIDVNGNVTKDITEMQFINPHAHVLATVRPMDEEGVWEKKSEIEYLCIRNGKERGFTSSEFQEAKEEGWEKQYKYADGKKKVWLTAEEGKERELERVSRAPKSVPYGRKNETVEYWNSKDRIFEWRQHWEQVVNNKFASINSETRIDSRSFKDQGREDEIPTMHMGTVATNMEKRAARELHEGKTEAQVIHSDIGNINKQIKEHNKFVRELKAKLEEIVVKAKGFAGEVAKRLEGFRARIIGNEYEESELTRKHNFMNSKLTPEYERLEKYKVEMEKAKKANDKSAEEIKRLQKEVKACTFLQFVKKNNLQAQIQEEQENIETRKEYMSNISKMCGYSSEEEFQQAKKEYIKKYDEYKKLGLTIEEIKQDTESIVSEYEATLTTVQKADVDEVTEERKESRSEMEGAAQDKLKEKYGYGFDAGEYYDARKKADKILGEKDETHRISLIERLGLKKDESKSLSDNIPEKRKSKTFHR